MKKNPPYQFSVPSAWYEGSREEKVERKAGRPFSLVHEEKSHRAVLCIHGYAGYPGELVRPAEDLYEKGFDVFVPRLPGNGTTGEDFMRTKAKDWLRVVDKAVESLLSSYESVDLVGHSMGGALAVLLAARHEKVRKVVLACPAVGTKMLSDGTRKTLKFISFFRRRLLVSWKSDPSYHLHYEDAPGDDQYYGGEYWSWQYTRQLLALLSLMDEATEALDKVKQPVLLITAGQDALIKPEGGKKAEESLGGEVKHLHIQEATHYIYYDKYPEAEEKAVAETVDFLSR